jgi:hypothetical protein
MRERSPTTESCARYSTTGTVEPFDWDRESELHEVMLSWLSLYGPLLALAGHEY